MTTKLDNEAAKAALLVKQTAEATATTMNISQIQKDIAEIKQTLKENAGTYTTAVEHKEVLIEINDHETRIRDMEKNNWKFIGMASGITALLSYLVPVLTKAFIK